MKLDKIGPGISAMIIATDRFPIDLGAYKPIALNPANYKPLCL